MKQSKLYLSLSFFIFLIFAWHCAEDKQQNLLPLTSLDTYLFPKEKKFSKLELKDMLKAHPNASRDFFYFILGLDTNTLFNPNQHTAEKIDYFRRQHQIIFDTLASKSLDWNVELKELQRLIVNYRQLLNPKFELPPIYTYTGPIDAPAVALFTDWIGVNLTLFAGKFFPLYQTYEFQSVFPIYLHHRLDKRYFPYFLLQQILLDAYPLKEKTYSLLEKMINAGKYWYIIERCAANNQEDRISMFTPSQLKWCDEHEAQIFSHLKTTVTDLYTTSPDIIRNYIGEAPKTNGMPDESPGNLGAWIGWKIVQSFMDKNKVDLQTLMDINPYQLFQQSAYNPH